MQVSPGLAKGPAFDESSVLPCVDMLGPLPQPITTYHDALTSDKLPFSHVLIPASVTSLPSAAALKSLKILSKFWGDEVEEGEDCSLEVTSEDIPAASKEACPLTLKHQRRKINNLKEIISLHLWRKSSPVQRRVPPTNLHIDYVVLEHKEPWES